MRSGAPPRIEPFYEVPKDLEDTDLVPLADAELTQDGKIFTGKLRVVQQWAPMFAYVEFLTPSASEIKAGEAHVESPKVTTKISVDVLMANGIRGSWSGGLDVGTSHKLDRVTFHLPNYPDLYGGQNYDETIENGDRQTSLRWSEVVLENDGWRIALQPHRQNFDLRQDARSRRVTLLSGLGEIRRLDGTQFNKRHVKPILEAFRVFFSFALAEWVPPLFVVGSNSVSARTWQMWTNFDVTKQWYSRGWLDERHGQHLAEALPGFCELWRKNAWRLPLEQAVTWLIEASRMSGGTEGAIAFGQIPLEMLSWLVFVDDVPILDADEFEKLSAGNKLQLLLSKCGIPLDIPPAFTALSTVANGADKKMSGPRIATEVRNTIIHPQKKNREKVPGWVSKHGVKEADLLWETQQLFKWYITLILLKLMNYNGSYANRLSSHKFGTVEPVPWAPKTT